VSTEPITDDERDRVMAILREQAAEGRLDMDEFGHRLDEAYGAATVADLEHALRDLPVPSLRQRQTTSPPRPQRPYRQSFPAPAPQPRRVPHGHDHPHPHGPKGIAVRKAMWHAHLSSYVLVNLMLVVIWLFTTPGGYFWPVWPMFGWGIGLAAHGMCELNARHRQGG
jgi:hypothetical protein